MVPVNASIDCDTSAALTTEPDVMPEFESFIAILYYNFVINIKEIFLVEHL